MFQMVGERGLLKEVTSVSRDWNKPVFYGCMIAEKFARDIEFFCFSSCEPAFWHFRHDSRHEANTCIGVTMFY